MAPTEARTCVLTTRPLNTDQNKFKGALNTGGERSIWSWAKVPGCRFVMGNSSEGKRGAGMVPVLSRQILE